MKEEDLKELGPEIRECIRFHGHFCPGLAIGIQASNLAMEYLDVQRPRDEELVCVVENDACGVDAVQFITGCTFGKGNLIFRDYGKQAFSFFDRKKERGIRLLFKKIQSFKTPHMDEILEKMRDGTATPQEEEIWRNTKKKRGSLILRTPAKDLFILKPIPYNPPDKAVVMHSIKCTSCGEDVMASKTFHSTDGPLCTPCYFQGYPDPDPDHGVKPIYYKPIGFVKREEKDRVSPEALLGRPAEIHFLPEYRDSLFRLNEVKQLYVLFHFHQSVRKLGLVKRRYDGEMVGVFNSRSPDRPNTIGMAEVEVISLTGNVLRVTGLDAIDGTPILDIKPILR